MCIFCKIINNEIPSVKVFEDDNIVAFLDISQSTKGHTLIVPKKHLTNIYDLSENDVVNIFKFVPKIAFAITKAFNAKGINLVNNNNEAAGQSVFHYHVHLIPRYDQNDGFKTYYENNMSKFTKDELQNIARDIKEYL